ncbi:MAG: YggS family pyridoxal phosphate-dependent enzyme [Bacteroidetes bacterium]|nr:YggS family pyridoxal phosphate-dependent enzyme [Bacteroidota bacterium]
MSIIDNLNQIKTTIPANVTLVAVSKTHTAEAVLEAYSTGQRVFGENKVQELCAKQLILPNDIEWHFIGHLQSNKVKYIAPFITLIHSVDSLKVLTEINKEGIKNNRTISCLLEFYIASEESKFGLDLTEAEAMLENPIFKTLDHICIAGVMGMASYTDDQNIIKNEFRQLVSYFNQLKAKYFSACADFKEISMGMSGDYLLAIKEGSTMVRVGSSIFGERNYR